MKKNKDSKLSLRRTTVRALDREVLAEVGGGSSIPCWVDAGCPNDFRPGLHEPVVPVLP